MREIESVCTYEVAGGLGGEAAARRFPKIQLPPTNPVQVPVHPAGADSPPVEVELIEDSRKFALLRHRANLSLFYVPPDAPFLDGGY